MWIKSKDKPEFRKLFKDYDDHDHYFNKELNCIMCISKNSSEYHRVTSPNRIKNINGTLFGSEILLEPDSGEENEKKLIAYYEPYDWKGACIYTPLNFSFAEQFKIYNKCVDEIYHNNKIQSDDAF